MRIYLHAMLICLALLGGVPFTSKANVGEFKILDLKDETGVVVNYASHAFKDGKYYTLDSLGFLNVFEIDNNGELIRSKAKKLLELPEGTETFPGHIWVRAGGVIKDSVFFLYRVELVAYIIIVDPVSLTIDFQQAVDDIDLLCCFSWADTVFIFNHNGIMQSISWIEYTETRFTLSADSGEVESKDIEQSRWSFGVSIVGGRVVEVQTCEDAVFILATDPNTEELHLLKADSDLRLSARRVFNGLGESIVYDNGPFLGTDLTTKYWYDQVADMSVNRVGIGSDVLLHLDGLLYMLYQDHVLVLDEELVVLDTFELEEHDYSGSMSGILILDGQLHAEFVTEDGMLSGMGVVPIPMETGWQEDPRIIRDLFISNQFQAEIVLMDSQVQVPALRLEIDYPGNPESHMWQSGFVADGFLFIQNYNGTLFYLNLQDMDLPEASPSL